MNSKDLAKTAVDILEPVLTAAQDKILQLETTNLRLREENKALKEQISELERLKGIKWRGPWKR